MLDEPALALAWLERIEHYAGHLSANKLDDIGEAQDMAMGRRARWIRARSRNSASTLWRRIAICKPSAAKASRAKPAEPEAPVHLPDSLRGLLGRALSAESVSRPVLPAHTMRRQIIT
jgi:hypothetical protein